MMKVKWVQSERGIRAQRPGKITIPSYADAWRVCLSHLQEVVEIRDTAPGEHRGVIICRVEPCEECEATRAEKNAAAQKRAQSFAELLGKGFRWQVSADDVAHVQTTLDGEYLSISEKCPAWGDPVATKALLEIMIWKRAPKTMKPKKKAKRVRYDDDRAPSVDPERMRRRAKETLFAQSHEKDDLAKALGEWGYFGVSKTVGTMTTDCELCGQPDISIWFEIKNESNQKTLWIGSDCIKRFEIRVWENGRVLALKDGFRKVDHDIRTALETARMGEADVALILLIGKETEFTIADFDAYYRARGAFTPAQMLFIARKMDEHSVDCKLSSFDVACRKDREKEQLAAMSNEDIMKIAGALSPAQRNMANG